MLTRRSSQVTQVQAVVQVWFPHQQQVILPQVSF
jgi:hypothetical protein